MVFIRNGHLISFKFLHEALLKKLHDSSLRIAVPSLALLSHRSGGRGPNAHVSKVVSFQELFRA